MSEPTTDPAAPSGQTAPHDAPAEARRTAQGDPADTVDEAGPDPWAGIPLALLAGSRGYDTDTAGGCG